MSKIQERKILNKEGMKEMDMNRLKILLDKNTIFLRQKYMWTKLSFGDICSWKKIINRNVITILSISQNVYKWNKVILWLKYCDNIVLWGLWQFPPLITIKSFFQVLYKYCDNLLRTNNIFFKINNNTTFAIYKIHMPFGICSSCTFQCWTNLYWPTSKHAAVFIEIHNKFDTFIPWVFFFFRMSHLRDQQHTTFSANITQMWHRLSTLHLF